MKRIVSFFEIFTANFERAVAFYEHVLSIELQVFDFGSEKMACFPNEDSAASGSLSWAESSDFKPSTEGILLSLYCENMEKGLATVEKNGGKIVIPKTKIEIEGRGYFSVIVDSEGNRLGLYADK